MALVYRTATDDDFDAICDLDAAAFGEEWKAEERPLLRPTLELDRFVVVYEGPRLVATSGAFTQELTVPGPRPVAAAGVTWVAVSVTHRRRGILTEMMRRLHDQAQERGEAITMLTASEGAIYGRFGYGVASHRRVITLDRRRAQVQERFAPAPGEIWHVDAADDAVLSELDALFDRVRRARVGEVARTLDLWRLGRLHRGDMAQWIRHRDGFACWTVTPKWNAGHPAHEVDVRDVVAATPEAYAALWHTILSIDLVGPIRNQNAVAPDDPLPHLLTDQRALRTTDLNDMIWVRLGDIPAALAARTYGTDDRLVVDVGEDRYVIDGGPDGATVARRRVSSRRADLAVDPPGLGAIYLGGVRPSTLVRARRATARDDRALRRADLFFAAEQFPHCSTEF